jgi:hypothetical protein
MKTNLSFFLIVLSITFGFAQQYPPVTDGSPEIEAEADYITEAYDKELAMTVKQKALFKLKVEDYLIIRKEIESQYDGKEELTALAKLQTKETLDMNDILTRIQMKVYKRIKPEIQPLKIVENE